MNNPILSILNQQPKAPVAIPQSANAMPQGPAAVNLTNAPEPQMAPAAPMGFADLPTGGAPTTSLDLPASLQGLLGQQTPQQTVNQAAIQQIPTGTVASNPQAPVLDFRLQPTFARGGMVGQDGSPVLPAGVRTQGTPARMTPQQMEQQLNDFLKKNPQQVAQIQNAMMAGLQAGEITIEDVNMMEQLASTALQNPDMYSYIRNFAIQQGYATEQDLSPEYDQGLIFVLLLAARAVKQMGVQTGGMGGNALQGQQPVMNMATGGMVQMGDHAAMGGKVEGPGTETSDSIPIRVSRGEYVIPAHIVKMKGKEFFDSMLEKYKDA